jgi:hypothetical protein
LNPEDDLQGDEPHSTDPSGSIRTFKASPADWCQIGAEPRRTRRTESTSLTTCSLISSREDHARSAEFAPDRDFGSEGWGFESLRARYLLDLVLQGFSAP